MCLFVQQITVLIANFDNLLVIAEGGLHVPIMQMGGNSHRSSPVNLAQFFGRDIMSQVRICYERVRNI